MCRFTLLWEVAFCYQFYMLAGELPLISMFRAICNSLIIVYTYGIRQRIGELTQKIISESFKNMFVLEIIQQP